MANTGNTQQIINYGATANDGTGDPLRTAFIKVDENFDNVWLAGPVGSNITIGNNTIQSNNTNGNIILKPNGVGIVQANASIIPNADNTRDLGSSTLNWRRAYINELLPENLTVSGDTTIGGNLTVEGDTIQIGNITTDTLTIQLANTAANKTAANGAGITVGANDSIATFLFNSTSNTWVTNVGANVSGNITASYFIGNGSQLTGLPASYGNANVANYLPTYTGNISAGNISVSNVVNITQNLNVKTGSFTGDATGVNSIYAGFPTFTVLGSDVIAQFSGNVNAYTQFNLQNGNVGSQASGDYVITADNGNDTTHFLNIGLTGGNWDGSQPNSLNSRLGPNDGYMYVQDGNLAIGVKDGNVTDWIWRFDITGSVTADGNLIPSANGVYSLGNATNYWANLWVANNTIYIGGVPLGITSGNVLTVDGEPVLVNDSNTSITTTGNITADTFFGSGVTAAAADDIVSLNAFDAGGNTVSIQAQGNTASAVIETYSVAGNNRWTWSFDNTGTLNFPASQTSIFGGYDNDFTINTSNTGNAVYTFTFSQFGDLSVPINLYVSGNVYTNDIVADTGNVAITANTQSWLFDDTGTITLPSEGQIRSVSNVGMRLSAGATDITGLLLNNTGDAELYANANVSIYADSANTGQGWIFDTTGNLTLPNSGSIIVDGDGVIGPVSDDLVISWDNEELILRSVAGSIELQADNDLDIQTGYSSGAGDYEYKWVFGNNNELVNITGDSAIVTEAGNLAISGGRDGLSSGNVTVRAVDVGVAVRDWTFDNAGDLTVPNYIYFRDGTFIGDEGGALPPVFRVDAPLGLGIDLTTDSNISGNNYTWSFAIDGNLTAPGDITTTGNITAGNINANVGGYSIGYRDIPQIAFTGNATIATTDAGKHYYSTQSTDYILTIANNASQGFQVGAAITVVNQGTGNITLAQGSGVTLYLTGNATSGNRTLTTFGMATLLKVATDTWFVSGAGVI